MWYAGTACCSKHMALRHGSRSQGLNGHGIVTCLIPKRELVLLINNFLYNWAKKKLQQVIVLRYQSKAKGKNSGNATGGGGLHKTTTAKTKNKPRNKRRSTCRKYTNK